MKTGISPYLEFAYCRVCGEWVKRTELIGGGIRCPRCHMRVRLSPKRSSEKKWISAMEVEEE